ncbi:MAG: hypothetical protein FWC80_05250 [Firmicutes bacterium]|nr:hypothetical protein [Bacillota bacterium]
MYCDNCGNNLPQNISTSDDQGGFLWGFIGYLTSLLSIIVPLLLICLWRKDYPKRTRAIFLGVLTNFLISLFLIPIVGFFLVVYTDAVFIDFVLFVFVASVFVSLWFLATALIYKAIKPRTP